MKSLASILFTMIALWLNTRSMAQDFGDEKDEPQAEVKEEKTPIPLKDRFYFGGNVGAQFGTYTFVLLSPLVGFKLTEKWSVGTRVTYQYLNVKYTNFTYTNHVVGSSLFTRYFIYKGLFAHTEYEVLNGDWTGLGERSNVYSLFVGGGYLHRISKNAGFGISALYNLTPSTYTPYANPIINAGFTIGL